MKRFLWILVFLVGSLYASSSRFPIDNLEEGQAFFLRRIVEFFEEQEFSIVKREIFNYLSEYPDSSLNDYLYVILGDLLIDEKDYSQAVAAYSHIKNKELIEDIGTNLIQCLYELKRYKGAIFYTLKYIKSHQDLEKAVKDKLVFCLGDCFFQEALASEENIEQQKKYASRAKNCFSSLIDSGYQENVLIYLSHIYQMLEEYVLAGDIFVLLSEKNKDRQEEFLLQAALFYSDKDREKAIETFRKVMGLKGDKAQEAAEYCMQLLYFSEKYQEIIEQKNHLQKVIEPRKARMVNWYVGKSYFACKQYDLAVAELLHFIELEKSASDWMHEALLLVMKSAVNLSDKKTYDTAYLVFEELFPSDEQMPMTLLAKAFLEKDNAKALIILEKIEENHPDFNKRFQVLFERAHLNFLLDKGEESRSLFKEYVQAYTEDRELLQKAWDGLVEASLLYITQISADKKPMAQLEFIQDLQNYLTAAPKVTEEKKAELSYALACMEYEVKDYEHAIVHFEKILDKHPSHENITDIYYYLALSYRSKGDHENFSQCLTKAMDGLSENDERRKDFHLMLYNTYLQLAQKEEKYYAQAAEHLFEVQRLSFTLTEDNLLWLAEFYYQQVDKECRSDFSYRLIDHPKLANLAMRSIEILSAYEEQPIISVEQLIYEKYLLQLAELHRLMEKEAGSIKVLQHLLEQYEESPTLAWKYQEKTYYLYALNNEKQGNYDESLKYYQKVEKLSSKTYYSIASSLNRLRIQIKGSKEESSVADHLSQLKSIQLKKNLYNEPLHLEAGYEYIDLRASLETDLPKKAKKKLELIAKLKKDYASDDIMSSEYRNLRKRDSQKDALYLSYMEMLDIEGVLCKAILAKEEQKQKLFEEARNRLSQYQEKNKIVTQYLLKRWEKNIQLLESFENEYLSSER